MPQEILILALAAVLLVVHIQAAIRVKTKQYGIAWNMGARDDAMPQPAPVVGRLERARDNFLETLPIAIIALFGVEPVAAIAAAITPADVVLEPSAGTGLLAIHAERAGASLVLNEFADTRAEKVPLS